MQGRFDDAERLARDALAAAESAGNWNGITSSRVQLAWCWKDVGRGAEHAAEVERFVQDEVLTRPQSGGAAAMWNGNLALFMAEAGLDARRASTSTASPTATTPSSRGTSTGAAPRRSPPRPARCWRRAPRAALLRAAAAARRPLHPRRPRRLLPGRGRALPRAPRRDAGPDEDAVRHLEDALQTNTRAQAPPWIARSLLELARALLARGGPGDERRAADLLRRAELLARDLGMRSLAAQVALERSAINAPSRPRR